MPFPHGCKGDEACILYACRRLAPAGPFQAGLAISMVGSLASDVTADRSVSNNLKGTNSGFRVANAQQEHARRF
jgi:hypothetical protein